MPTQGFKFDTSMIPGYSDTTRVVSSSDYFFLSINAFSGMCENIYRANKKWIDETVGDPDVRHILVARDGKILEKFYDNRVPSVLQVREKAQEYGMLVFLLSRPADFMNTVIYFQDKNELKILELLERKGSKVSIYNEGIKQLPVQSGALVKLRPQFALGHMTVQSTKTSELPYKEGTTVVRVQNWSFDDGKGLYISSQFEAKSHKRGVRTTTDREPNRWVRMERLHRFDNPVLDILDTYEMERLQGWPELLLYENIKNRN